VNGVSRERYSSRQMVTELVADYLGLTDGQVRGYLRAGICNVFAKVEPYLEWATRSTAMRQGRGGPPGRGTTAGSAPH
jgi:hypothetical protein